MFLRIFIIVVLFFSVLSIFFIKPSQPTAKKIITGLIKQLPLKLELALSQAEHFQGLSNRSDLCDNCGMLFIFPEADFQTFVMREMNFPLDIIWLNNQKVVAYNENLLPEDNPPYTLYKSPSKVDSVLELKAGFVAKNNIKIDDLLIYEKTN